MNAHVHYETTWERFDSTISQLLKAYAGAKGQVTPSEVAGVWLILENTRLLLETHIEDEAAKKSLEASEFGIFIDGEIEKHNHILDLLVLEPIDGSLPARAAERNSTKSANRSEMASR